MANIVVTPWRSHQDLLDVRAKLFAHNRGEQDEHVTSDDSSSIAADRQRQQRQQDEEERQAIDTVAMWECRGGVPHPVVATANLVDALLTYRQHNERADTSTAGQTHQPLPPFAARALLATALARFVTGYCDVGHSSTSKRSMYDVAAALHMPAEFVAMRHAITHGAHLPAVAPMHALVPRALDWLWGAYWAKLDDDDARDDAGDAGALSVAQQAQVQSALKLLLRARKDFIKARGKLFPAQACDAVLAVVGTHGAGAAGVAAALVRERLLLPSTKTALVVSSSPNMKAAFLIWDQPLDYLFARLGALHGSLVTQLQQQLIRSGIGDVERACVSAWIVHLLTDVFASVHDLQRQEACETTIEFCLLNPCAATAELSQSVLAISPDDTKRAWTGLCDASNKAMDASDAANIEMELDMDPHDTSTTSQEGSWQPYQGIWTPRPIGMLEPA